MPFSITDFRSQMTGDGARPNLFECSIPNLNTILPNSDSKFKFMCRAAQLPGSTVNAVPVNYFGRELKFAGNRTFTEWTVTIINDEDFLVRNAFEIWLNRLNSHVENVRASNFRSPSQYQFDAEVVQYGKTGESQGPNLPNSGTAIGIKKYKFVGMFPIDLSPIELDWGANDTIEEFAVTFAYQWWEASGGGTGTTTT